MPAVRVSTFNIVESVADQLSPTGVPSRRGQARAPNPSFAPFGRSRPHLRLQLHRFSLRPFVPRAPGQSPDDSCAGSSDAQARLSEEGDRGHRTFGFVRGGRARERGGDQACSEGCFGASGFSLPHPATRLHRPTFPCARPSDSLPPPSLNDPLLTFLSRAGHRPTSAQSVRSSYPSSRLGPLYLRRSSSRCRPCRISFGRRGAEASARDGRVGAAQV